MDSSCKYECGHVIGVSFKYIGLLEVYGQYLSREMLAGGPRAAALYFWMRLREAVSIPFDASDYWSTWRARNREAAQGVEDDFHPARRTAGQFSDTSVYERQEAAFELEGRENAGHPPRLRTGKGRDSFRVESDPQDYDGPRSFVIFEPIEGVAWDNNAPNYMDLLDQGLAVKNKGTVAGDPLDAFPFVEPTFYEHQDQMYEIMFREIGF